jgi:hypothetical protein
MTIPLPHQTIGTMIDDVAWNDPIDAINMAFTEIGSTTGIVKRLSQFRGLNLRTHPDPDQAANKVALFGLTGAVMSDGAFYSSITPPLFADISVSGAGGLDTGARVASTWYEIHLIGKSSTKAPADLRLILHRAKRWQVDQSQNNGPVSAALRDVSTRTKLAQSIIPALTGPCEFKDVSVLRLGAPTGNIWLTIETDASGSPSGSALATSNKLPVAAMPTTGSPIARFIFPSPATLTAGTTYHIVMQGDFAISATDCVLWRGDSANSYPSGSAKNYNGSVWGSGGVGSVLDFHFTTTSTQNVASVTMPSGYDETCLLGYVYNNSSNILSPFVARDRRVTPMGTGSSSLLIGSISATIPTLVTLTSLLPPTPTRLTLRFANNTTTNFNAAAGAPDGLSFTGTIGGEVGSVLAYAPNTSVGYPRAPLGSIVSEYQGIYVLVQGGTGEFYLAEWEW